MEHKKRTPATRPVPEHISNGATVFAERRQNKWEQGKVVRFEADTRNVEIEWVRRGLGGQTHSTVKMNKTKPPPADLSTEARPSSRNNMGVDSSTAAGKALAKRNKRMYNLSILIFFFSFYIIFSSSKIKSLLPPRGKSKLLMPRAPDARRKDFASLV